MASVKKHLPVLKLIQEAPPKLRYRILRHSDLKIIKTIYECIYNTLMGNISLTKSEIIKLKQFKKILREILHTDGGLKEKRRLILQSGGSFLPTLLEPIITAAVINFIDHS